MKARVCLTAAALLITPLATLAQGHAGHSGHAMPAAAPTATASAASPWSTGEVRRIDAANGRVSLRHGEIASLNMPPMMMAFEVRDAAQLAGLAVGDAVRFTVKDLGGGRLQITAIEKTP